MNKEDKQRAIGKVVGINSDRFTIELLGGIENFNVSGFDDIHYFAQLNSYVVIPYQNYYIIAEVSGVREKDYNTSFTNPREQSLNKVRAGKFVDVLPIGTLKPTDTPQKTYRFDFGVSVFPPLYSDALYIKESELDAIFNVAGTSQKICTERDDESECPHGENSSYQTLSIGKSTIFPDYEVKISIDKFFGGHSAILGNTGSGKSCTISSMIQGLYKLKNYSATGSTFVLFDVNGEYKRAFSQLTETNDDILFQYLTLDHSNASLEEEKFKLPSWFLSIDEWALLLQATEKTQLPILRNALGLAVLFSTSDSDDLITSTKNHILATCITQILRDETSSPSKSDRIHSILRRFNTGDIYLEKEFSYFDDTGTERTEIIYDGSKRKRCSIQNSLYVHFGGLIGKDELHDYLEREDQDGNPIFLSSDFELPVYEKESKFSLEVIEEVIDLAILYEEAHGNRQIRDYCSSMITRVKSVKYRPDFDFLRTTVRNINQYKRKLIGLRKNGGTIKKRNQVVVIDLSGAEDEVIEVVSSVIARMLYDLVKEFKPRNQYPINLVLEEAHRYIGNDSSREFLKANRIFERIAKEGRKFGLFILLSSQRPSELSRTVLSQCSNFIVHRIQNPEDLSHIRQITPHISEAILKRMPSIPTQHALIFGHSVNLPTTFKVNQAEPKPLSDNNEVSKNWFKNKNFVPDIETGLG